MDRISFPTGFTDVGVALDLYEATLRSRAYLGKEECLVAFEYFSKRAKDLTARLKEAEAAAKADHDDFAKKAMRTIDAKDTSLEEATKKFEVERKDHMKSLQEHMVLADKYNNSLKACTALEEEKTVLLRENQCLHIENESLRDRIKLLRPSRGTKAPRRPPAIVACDACASTSVTSGLAMRCSMCPNAAEDEFYVPATPPPAPVPPLSPEILCTPSKRQKN